MSEGFLIELKRETKIPAKLQPEAGTDVLPAGTYITKSNNFKNFIAGLPIATFKFINNIPDYLDDWKDNDTKPTLLESAKAFFEKVGDFVEDVVDKIKGEAEETVEDVKDIIEDAVEDIVEEVVGDVEVVAEEIIEEVKEFITEEAFRLEVDNLIKKSDKGFADLRQQLQNEIKAIKKTVEAINGGVKSITAKVDGLNSQLITEKGRVTKLVNKVDELCREDEQTVIAEVVAEAIPEEAEVSDIELPVDKELADKVEALTQNDELVEE